MFMYHYGSLFIIRNMLFSIYCPRIKQFSRFIVDLDMILWFEGLWPVFLCNQTLLYVNSWMIFRMIDRETTENYLMNQKKKRTRRKTKLGPLLNPCSLLAVLFFLTIVLNNPLSNTLRITNDRLPNLLQFHVILLSFK